MKGKRTTKGIICTAIAAAMISAFLAGCTNEGESDLGNTGSQKTEKAAKVEDKQLEADSVVIAVGDEEATYRELLVYMYILKDRYQDTLGDDIWNYRLDNGKTFKSATMAQVVSLITELKIIGRKAEGLGISLTSDEKEDIRQYVEGLYNNISAEDIEEYMLDTDTMTRVYCENEIANRVYDSCINGVNTSINDDDSRQCKVWYIYLRTSGVNQSGVTVTLSEEEVNKRYKEAKKLLKSAKKKNPEDFLSFAEANTESDSAELVFGKGDMSAEFEAAALALSEGQLSGVVTAPEGFYIIYCVDENDEELAAAKKEEMIAIAQKQNFEAQYGEWAAGFEVQVSELIMQ
ncbi:MAG: peptidylprolyl isomerase [Lachnospiraceae bacterium]|nr:peptidylprolyl isomerase [Lachnospiraceae bacterium]